MSDVDRHRTQSPAGGGVYQFTIAGAIGPLTRAALPDMDTRVFARFTVLTGTCNGPDDLHRLLTALDTQGIPLSRVRVAGTPARRLACKAIKDPTTNSPKGAPST
jgi:hypothetical protein